MRGGPQHDHDDEFTVPAVEELSAAQPRCRPALAAASMANVRRLDDLDNAVGETLRRQRSR